MLLLLWVADNSFFKAVCISDQQTCGLPVVVTDFE